ncbi:MAG: FAD-dependent oxidoreductase [Bacteroidota bacterium]
MEKRIAVVGGGISGLSLAHYCATSGFSVVLIDKHSLGGCLKSIELGKGGYIEMGGHTLTHSYRTVIEILEHYGKEDQLVPIPNLKFEVFNGHEFSSILSRLRIFSLLFSLPNLFFKSKNGKSIKEYYSRVIGGGNYTNLFRHLFNAILCQNADNFPAELLFKKRRKNRSYPKKFVLKKGIQQLFDIVGGNPNIEVIENRAISSISFNLGQFQVRNGENMVAQAPFLALACPPSIAAKLLKSQFPKLSNLLGTISHATVTSVLVEILDEKSMENRQRSILGVNSNFYSARLIKKGLKSYWCFYFNSETIFQSAEKKQIGRIFGVDEDKVLIVKRAQFQLPKLTVPDLKTIAGIESELQGNNLCIASNYMEGLAIEDCALRGKREAQRLLVRHGNST